MSGTYYEKHKIEILAKLAIKRVSDTTQGSVYRLHIDGNNYIGSTKMIPELRYKLHLSAFKRYTLGLGTYCSAFEVFNNGDPMFEVLETVPVAELDLREKYWSQQFPVVNKNRIGLRIKENPVEYYKQWLDAKNPDKALTREFKRMAKVCV